MKYRKKPVVIDAVQWNGDNLWEAQKFCPSMTTPAMSNKAEDYHAIDKKMLIIPTLEGNHYCSVGDYIIKGIQGEFYPCKPDIFEQTYELVKE